MDTERRITFERQYRTPQSEGYHLMAGESRLGHLDLHFTSNSVYATLVLETTLAEAWEHISPLVGTLAEAPNGVVFRCSTSDLTWMAQYLAGLGFPLLVRQPPELRAALRQHGLAIAGFAERVEA